jgi:pimeloyl-ACP methyl ester carboxylesterase
MEIVKVPEPFRALILASQSLRPDVVLGYWDDIMRNDPEELQTRIEAAMGKTTCPYLAVFGRQLAPTEREYMLTRLEGLQITECPGNGHFVHLVDPDQFTSQLRSFLEFCTLRADSASPL